MELKAKKKLSTFYRTPSLLCCPNLFYFLLIALISFTPTPSSSNTNTLSVFLFPILTLIPPGVYLMIDSRSQMTKATMARARPIFWGPVMLLLLPPNELGSSHSKGLQGEGNGQRGFQFQIDDDARAHFC